VDSTRQLESMLEKLKEKQVEFRVILPSKDSERHKFKESTW